jgi:dTDP-L-rhamnose 4-epimerase
MACLFGRSYGFSVHALRYQNVYGPGQSLHNPYTGILAIFSNLARSGLPIQVFEDGLESRDFVFVEDAVEVTWLCMNRQKLAVESFNVGTGQAISVMQVAKEIEAFFGRDSQVVITGAFRQGDIRHNFADISSISQATGFHPRFSFPDGLHRFLDWVTSQDNVALRFESTLREMRERGLFVG